MGAFCGLRIPYDRTVEGTGEEPVGPPHYPGVFAWENANTPYVYPWGLKERNPFFVGPYQERQCVNTLRKYEKDESRRLQRIVEQMNELHADMGGRDDRPERVALLKAMALLQSEIDRASQEFVNGAAPAPTT